MGKPISLVVNGAHVEAGCRPDMTVLEWLRGEALLRGTKEGCAEGDCGACSVLVQRYGSDGFLAANSCILLMGQLEGAVLLTIEGIAAAGPDGHAVQQQMAENGSSQCGFCTPGIVISLCGLLERNQTPDEADIHDALAGNLCRCTGYRPIVEAAQAAVGGDCKLTGGKTSPPEIQVGGDDCVFFAPETLEGLLTLLRDHPDATLLGGGTDISLDVAHARARREKTIYTRHVAELAELIETPNELLVGGAVTWEEVLPRLQLHWPEFATLVRRFGSTQIRSMGTVAGNLATASPIGDGAPCLLALNASLILTSPEGERELPLDAFFVGYRKSALKDGEIIRSVRIPLPTDDLQFRVYKVSKRYDQDISAVCGAFALMMEGDVVRDARIAFGGMAAMPERCQGAEEALKDCRLDDDALSRAKKAVRDRFSPMTDMRGSAAYRALVAENLFERLAADLDGQIVGVMDAGAAAF